MDPYSHPVHPATDSDVDLEPNLTSDVESDSGWDSDLDSDPNTPRPVPAIQLTTTQRGRLTFRNRLIYWRPSVLDNYIKFRVYFKDWNKGYTHLVAENLLQVLSPVCQYFIPQLFLLTLIACISSSASSIFVYPSSGQLRESKNLFGFLLEANQEQQSDLLLLRQINTKMGEVHHDFWWRSISEREKQARTEEEAKLTNEKFGSHKGLSEEIKAQIAAKVNENKISYGEWKKLTTPTSDETYGPSVLHAAEAKSTESPTDETQGPSVLVSSAVELATQQMTNLDIPQSGMTAKQKKGQRRKGRQRMIKTLDQMDKSGILITENNSPSKLTLIKKAANEADNKIIDDNRDGNVLMVERTNVTNEQTEEAVPTTLSRDNQSSTSINIVDKGEGKGKAPIYNPVYEETDATSTIGHTDATQPELVSNIIPKEGNEKGKACAGDFRDIKTSESVDVLSKILAHSSQHSDVKVDKAREKTSVGNLPTQKDIHIIDLTNNGAVQSEEYFSTNLDKENQRLMDAVGKQKNPLGIALEEGKEEKPSDITRSDAESFHNVLAGGRGTPSNCAIVQSAIPLDISPSEEHEALSGMATAKNEPALNITPTNQTEALPRNATAQNSVRLNITLDAEIRQLLIIVQLDTQNDPSAGVASNQNKLPLNITIDTGTEERSTTALLDGQISQSIVITNNHGIDIKSSQDAQPFETILNTTSEKSPISALPGEEIDKGVDTVTESQISTEHASQSRSHNIKCNTSVINFAAKTDTSVDFARKVAIPKKEHLDILHNKTSGKGKALSDTVGDERIDHNIDIMSAKQRMPSGMTPHKEIKKAPIQDLSDKKINQDVSIASSNHNHIVHPSASSGNDLKGKIVAKDQIDESDPGVKAAGTMIAQHRQTSESILDERKEKESANLPSNNSPHQSTSTTSNYKAKTVHFDETWSTYPPEVAPIKYLVGKTMAASSNTASGEITHKELDSEASADESQRKAQASDSTYEKNQPNVGSPHSSKNHHNPAPFPPNPPLARARGATGLKWAYFTHTIADEALLASGVWLFEKPVTYFEYQPYHYVRRGMGLIQAPIAVATYEEDDVHETHEPGIDVDNIGVWINTHEEPWRDVRSKPTHPDFQPTSKLLEYQACESLGIAVWRHDRNLLNCRLPGCKAKIADHNPSTTICLGCGPKTITRYCSEAHQIADLGEHWKECGQPEFLMKRVIDATTSPARFGRLWPAIRDCSGSSSYERSRQATYAAMQRGRYTLFDPETEAPTALIWPTEDEQAAVMEDRVERLLNYALFDHKHGRITGLLYRMIRQCLIQKNFWAIGPIHAVKTQFAAEFGCDVSKVAEQPLCECEWVGACLPRDRHVAGCKRLYLAYSAEYQATGIQGFLEMMEGRYWGLRAWRQRHPTVHDWEARVSGWGFAGGVDGAAPFLGPGWTGWGSPADDLVD